MDHTQYIDQATNLSAEVAPFIPRSDIGNIFTEQMMHQNSSGQLPHYLTSCYPFVQDPTSGNGPRMNQLDYQGYRDQAGWPPQVPNSQCPHEMPPRFNGPPRFSAPLQGQTPNLSVPSDQSPIYSYHTGPSLFPPPAPQYPGVTNPQYPQPLYVDNQVPISPHHQGKQANHQGRRESGRKSADSKKSSSKKGRRSVGIQMEVSKNETEDDKEQSTMVDNSQQTDFPTDIASKSLSEKPSTLKKSRSSRQRRRAAASTAAELSVSCDSSDNNGDEADVDSDSGYYSPKHQISRRHNGMTTTGETRTDHHNVGTGSVIPPNYPANHVSPQRVMYVNPQAPMNPPSRYFHIHPTSLMPGQGHIIRLPGTGTSPIMMTPPTMRPAHTHQQHEAAIASFKSRSNWEQEILKAHNVAPTIPPPFFNPPHSAPMGANRFYPGGAQQGWRFPRYPSPGRGRYNRPNSGPHWQYDQNRLKVNSGSDNLADSNHGGSGGAGYRSEPGFLRLNPNSAPQHLKQQNPPQLTDEDFPGLPQPSAAGSELAGKLSSAFSYSAAVQNKPKPVPEINISEDSPIKNLVEPGDSTQGKGSRRRRKKTERAAKAAAEEYAEISKEQENIKKQLSKKSTSRPTKSRTPHLDLAEMLSKLEKKQDVDGNQFASQSKAGENTRPTKHSIGIVPGYQDGFPQPHNPLDSTAPSRKRGKEREIPKMKKPSALKKVILKEREEKKNNRITSLTTEANPECDVPSLPPDIFTADYMQKKNEVENNNSETEVSSTGAMHSDAPSPVVVSISGNSSPVVPANLPKIHSRRYREYCSQVLDKQIDETSTIILQRLVQFQERMYQKDPIKAKSKRRFVLGLREVTKHLKLKKLRCVLISPNLEKIQAKGGLDDAMQNILQLCKLQSIPYVFALGRCAMGRAVSKLVPVSIIGIFDYSGVEDQYKKMLDLVEEAKKKYNEMMTIYQQEAAVESSTPPVVQASAKRFAHMGHSRNPSAASCVSMCSMISEPISEMNPAEVTSWRNMMDTDESPGPALSPPPENALEDDQVNEESGVPDEQTIDEEEAEEIAAIDDDGQLEVNGDQDDYEEEESIEADGQGESSNPDSYLNAIDNSGSITSEEKPTNEIGLDKSFSTVSTVVAKPGKPEDKAKLKASRPSNEPTISSIMEHSAPSNSDTTARINSWLEASTTSVQDLEIEDSAETDNKQEDHVDSEDLENIQEEEDDFTSANEEVNDPGI